MARRCSDAGIELLVRHDQADRGVLGAARIRRGLRRLPVGRQALRQIPQQLRCQSEVAPGLCLVAGDQPAVAIGDGAGGIHDREGGNLGGADLAECAALAGMGVAAEIAALHRHPSGALRAQREHPGAQGVKCGLRQPLVRIDLVEAAAAEIVDDRARHDGDLGEVAGADAVVLEPGRNRRDGFLAIGRAARKHDGVGERTAVAEPQQVGIHGARPAAPNVDGHRRALRETDYRDAGRSLFVGADADLDGRPIECQNRAVDRGIGNKTGLVGRGRCAAENSGKNSRRHPRRHR